MRALLRAAIFSAAVIFLSSCTSPYYSNAAGASLHPITTPDGKLDPDQNVSFEIP